MGDTQTPSEAFQEARSKIDDAYRDGLRAFVAWIHDEWQGLGQQEWESSYADPYPGALYTEGWNAAIASLQGALECFADEHGL